MIMRNLIFSLLMGLTLTNCTYGQQFLVASSGPDGYQLLISKKDFAIRFAHDIAPYIGDGKTNEKFQFEDLLIDDPSPSDNGSHAYLVLKASSDKQTISIGVTLIKNVMTEQVTRLYMPSLSELTSESATVNSVAGGEAGWKCTSVKTECGGCRRVRENGAVVACPCFSGDGNCVFEITGGGGNNWPAWLTTLITTILRMF